MKINFRFFSAILALMMVLGTGLKSNAQTLVPQSITPIGENSYSVHVEESRDDIDGLKNNAFVLDKIDILKRKFKSDEIANPNGMYIRQAVDFIPNRITTDYYYSCVGTVRGDNLQGSSPLTITFEYSSSGTTTGSIGGYAEGSAEAGVILAKTSAKAGVELKYSRSWTKGTKISGIYAVPAGKKEKIEVFFPAVKATGSIKYKVWMDGYPSNIFYEYKDVYGIAALIADEYTVKTSPMR